MIDQLNSSYPTQPHSLIAKYMCYCPGVTLQLILAESWYLKLSVLVVLVSFTNVMNLPHLQNKLIHRALGEAALTLCLQRATSHLSS